MLKRQRIESQPLRQSAKAEQCTVQIVGACRHDEETTVLAHLPGVSGGVMGGKASDHCAAYACHACHDVIDGRAPWPPGQAEHAEWYMRRAMVETWHRAFEMGVISIKGAKR